MRLVDLNPNFVYHGGEGVKNAEGKPIPKREGVGLAFDCPCGCGRRAYIDFENPMDGGPPINDKRHVWKRTREDFETMTLEPSIQRMDGCRWHGWIRNGNIVNT